jgi:hypothetical protein
MVKHITQSGRLSTGIAHIHAAGRPNQKKMRAISIRQANAKLAKEKGTFLIYADFDLFKNALFSSVFSMGSGIQRIENECAQLFVSDRIDFGERHEQTPWEKGSACCGTIPS